ncbi:hypothetical protein ACQJBY_061290 [Aegilops geniculata]
MSMMFSVVDFIVCTTRSRLGSIIDDAFVFFLRHGRRTTPFDPRHPGNLRPPRPRLRARDAGVHEPDATVDDSYSPTTLEVPTVTGRPLTTTRSSLGGSQAGGLLLFRSVSQFVLAFLRQTCLTYVCTQILLLPLTRL